MSQLVIWIPVIVLGVVTANSSALAPLLIGAIVDQLDLNIKIAGFIVGAEMLGMAVASIVALFVIRRNNAGQLVKVVIAIMIVANFLSIISDTGIQLIFSRFMTGIGEGVGFALMSVMLAKSNDTDRLFAIFFACHAALVSVVIKIWPMVVTPYGIEWIFVWFLSASIGLILIIKPIENVQEIFMDEFESMNSFGSVSRTSLYALLGFFIFAAAANGAWSLIERHGISSGLSGEMIASALMLATIFGLVGAISSAYLSKQINRKNSLKIGVVLLTLAMALSLNDDHVLFYKIGASLFMAAWVFSNPFMLGTLAKCDCNGRTAILGTTVLYAGLAIGPIWAAVFWDKGGYRSVIIVAILICVVSLGVMLYANSRIERAVIN